MAIIRKPKTELGISNVGGINPSSPEGSVSSIGADIENFGRAIEGIGEAYFKESAAATSAGVYADTLSKASAEFMQQLNDRKTQTRDENGMPTFQSLVPDIGKIGNELKARFGDNIQDERTRNKFNSEFGNYIANQQLVGFKEARNQQMDLVKSSLETGLDTAKSLAVSDIPENVPMYIDLSKDLIEEAFRSGAISQEEANEKLASADSDIIKAKLSQLAITNPEEVLLELQNEDLNLSSEDKESLAEMARGRIEEVEYESFRESTYGLKDAALVEAELSAMVEGDRAGYPEIEKAFNEDLIDEPQKDKLVKQKSERLKKLTKKEITNLEISETILSGAPLIKYTPKEIDDHFLATIEALEEKTGEPATLLQKASVAGSYTGRVKSIENELEYQISFGDDDKAIEAVRAIEYLSTKNPYTLESVKTETLAVASTASLWVKSAGLSDEAAIRRARELVLEKDEERNKQRAKDFKKNERYEPSRIKRTVQEMFGVDGRIFGRASVPDSISDTMRDLLEDAYILTGSQDIAEDVVTKQTQRFFGVTKVNGGKTLMFLPPEKVFPGVEEKDLTKALRSEVKGIIPSWANIEDVKIEGDDLTRAPLENISYGLYITQTEGGIEEDVPLTDPNTGEVLRWVPDVDKLYDAKNKRKKAKEKQSRKIRHEIGRIRAPTIRGLD